MDTESGNSTLTIVVPQELSGGHQSSRPSSGEVAHHHWSIMKGTEWRSSGLNAPD